MRVRTIQVDEIEKYSNIGVDKPDVKPLSLGKWLDQNRTRLAWCFVVEEGDVFLGRVIYGVLESSDNLVIWQIQLASPDVKNLSVGSYLLKQSMEQMKNYHYKSIEFHSYSSNLDNFTYHESLFTSQGFEKVQQKLSFECETNKTMPFSGRLSFKPIKDTGKEVFIEAIEGVSNQTLDQDDALSISKYGSKKAATMYYDLLEEIHYDDAWWRLAFDRDKKLAGLVVPQRFNEEVGAINYIGVVPNQRGKGYVNDLIVEATHLLLESGVKRIIADIDVNNRPLEIALIKNGYVLKNNLIVYKYEI